MPPATAREPTAQYYGYLIYACDKHISYKENESVPWDAIFELMQRLS